MKFKFKIILGLFVLIGALIVVNYADSAVVVTHYNNSDISYMLNTGTNTEQMFTGVGTITITDGTDTITILDRNLGATAAGLGCEDVNGIACAGGDNTYGYHFQWGNNYGFNPVDNSIATTLSTVQWLPTYSNKGYFGSTFIKSATAPYDYWSDSVTNSGNHYDVWGGLSVDISDYDNNGIWKLSNPKNRQGPCPEGFHVPSYGELSKLVYMMNNSVNEINNKLLIPYAGYRANNDAITYNLGSRANIYTSSPNFSTVSRSPYTMGLSFSSTGIIGIGSAPRANAVSVRCFYDYYKAYVKPPVVAQLNLSILKGTLRIGTETGNLNLGEVNVSNSNQILSGSFGANSFWVEDMKGTEIGYYTTISVTALSGSLATHVISADNVSLKTAGETPSNISGATASEAKVIFGDGIKSWYSGSTPVNYFQRLNTSTAEAGRVGKWGDNLQIKVNIPAHTPYDTYRGTITYTLYDLDIIN